LLLLLLHSRSSSANRYNCPSAPTACTHSRTCNTLLLLLLLLHPKPHHA
jgi:hypothetical protein